jgi:hypothetical protein
MALLFCAYFNLLSTIRQGYENLIIADGNQRLKVTIKNNIAFPR